MSNIEWTNETWNPWQGCRKVSPGCKNCYMFRDKEKFGQDGSNIHRSADTTFSKPHKIKEPSLIFTCSWSDFFIEEADAWRRGAWQIIRDTPQHTYQILTKRTDRILDCLPDDWAEGYPNVWLGISVEDQHTAERHIPYLERINAKVKFVSFEPLLENIMLLNHDYDWAIIGGESGNETGKWRYRPTEKKWIEDLIQLHQQAGIPVFVKQLGTHLAREMHCGDRHGREMREWQNHLRIREFPK